MTRCVPPDGCSWSPTRPPQRLGKRDARRFLDGLDGRRKTLPVVITARVVIQTTSWNGTVVLAEYEVGLEVFDGLNQVAESCGWILDPARAQAAARRDAETLLELERERVLDTCVGQPLRDELFLYGVDSGAVFVDLPQPVYRAYLGAGVTVTGVETARARELGDRLSGGQLVRDRDHPAGVLRGGSAGRG